MKRYQSISSPSPQCDGEVAVSPIHSVTGWSPYPPSTVWRGGCSIPHPQCDGLVAVSPIHSVTGRSPYPPSTVQVGRYMSLQGPGWNLPLSIAWLGPFTTIRVLISPDALISSPCTPKLLYIHLKTSHERVWEVCKISGMLHQFVFWKLLQSLKIGNPVKPRILKRCVCILIKVNILNWT